MSYRMSTKNAKFLLLLLIPHILVLCIVHYEWFGDDCGYLCGYIMIIYTISCEIDSVAVFIIEFLLSPSPSSDLHAVERVWAFREARV